MNINANAPAVARHQIMIMSSTEKIWNLLSDIDHWSSWYPAISLSKLRGPLTPGTAFRWKSNKTPIVSVLQDVVPQTRLSWTGKAMGARALHVWALERHESGVIVKTEESFDGWMVTLLKRMMQKTLDRSLESWLMHLKQAAEMPG